MPRAPRFVPPHSLVHVIVRFNAGDYVMDTPGARSDYLVRLERALSNSDWVLIGYALMGNHVHLVLLSGVGALEVWSRPLHTGFAMRVNRLGARTGDGIGHVLASRPKSLVRPWSSAPYLLAYVHNNPAKAGVCRWARESSWTSHRAYLGDAEPIPCLDVARGLELCGLDDSTMGRRRFGSMVDARSGDPMDPVLEGEREPSPASLRALAFDVPTHFDGSAREVVDAVSEALRLTPRQVGRGRDLNAQRARRVLAGAWKQLGRETEELADAVGLGRRYVSAAARRGTEEELDQIDAVLALLFDREQAA